MVRNNWVSHLRRYPLKELRRRQCIAEAQLAVACQTAKHQAIIEITDMLDSLAETINITQFKVR